MFALLLAAASLGHAADDPLLEPRPVNISGDAVPLDEALSKLEKQTGNTIVDRRSAPLKRNPKLRLDLKESTFWPALDEITRQGGCGYSVYQEDGNLALTDKPLRRMQVSYSGICRLAVKRVSVTKDDETGTSYCNISLEVAWEPRFQPFFLDMGAAEAVLAGNPAGRKIRVPAHGEMNVAGRNAAEVELRMPAPSRSCPSLASLTGKFTMMGPTKMLTFRFMNWKAGQPIKEKQEGVEVTLTPQQLRAGNWPFGVVIDNPPGGPVLESHKADSWMANNDIYLEKPGFAKIRPLPSKVQDLGNTSATHAAMRWIFTRDLPAQPMGWSVVYRTPARVVVVPFAYAFKDVALP